MTTVWPQYEKHIFEQLGNEGKSANHCRICGLTQANTIHHQIDKSEPEIAHHGRITRDEMFMEIIEVVRKRSTCVRGKVGAAIVRDNRIVAIGYNGAPPGAPQCDELGCDVLENNHDAGCQRAIHAEANVIAWAARHGIGAEDGTMYCTHSPCLRCAQLIVSAGIKKLVYSREYRLERLDILEQGGLEVVRFGMARQD